MTPNELIKVNFKITRDGLTLAVWDRFLTAKLRDALNGSRADQIAIINTVRLLTKKKIWETMPIRSSVRQPNNWAGFIDWAEVEKSVERAVERSYDPASEIHNVPLQRVIDVTEQKAYP